MQEEKEKIAFDESRRVCTLSKDIIDLLVNQLSHELHNHSIYRTFSNYFGTHGLPDLEEYFNLRSEEEYKHHKWILWYLSYTDAEFQYPAVEPVNIEIKNNVIPFKETVDVEINTTMLINNIVAKALELNDYSTYAWLMGNDDEHGKLVLEQVEEESISRTILEMAQLDSDWHQKQETILEFYKND